MTAHPGQRGQQRRVRRRAEQIGGEAGHRGVVQRAQRDRERVGRLQPRPHRVLRRARLTGPDRDQPQDPVRGQPPGQRAERGHGGGVGPLRVVQTDQHRRPPGGPLEGFLHGPQQPEPLVGGVAEVAQDGRVDRRVGRVGRRYQRLEQRAERDHRPGRVARAGQDRDAPVAGGGRDGVEQRGLAQAGQPGTIAVPPRPACSSPSLLLSVSTSTCRPQSGRAGAGSLIAGGCICLLQSVPVNAATDRAGLVSPGG